MQNDSQSVRTNDAKILVKWLLFPELCQVFKVGIQKESDKVASNRYSGPS